MIKEYTKELPDGTKEYVVELPDTPNNTWLRVALEIVGDIGVGDEFVHCGYVFTVLSKHLAISNNFLGCAKYMDEELLPYVANPETECTICYP